MFEKIGIFVLFLGPLVFFHELGHYLFARLFGVRVEVFSIGFGPKLFKFKKGFTEYAISLIPLGGYVKMFGDDPLNREAIPEHERTQSFIFKGKWARFWIVMGGPLANFILAYFIFFSLLVTGEKLPEIRVGVVQPESVFYQIGFRSGDVIKKVNEVEISNPTDIALEGKELIKTMTISRLGQSHQFIVNKTGEEFFKEFLKYPPTLRKPIIIDSQGQMVALSFSSSKVGWELSYDEISQFAGGKKKEIYAFAVKAEPASLIGYKAEASPFERFKLDLKTPLALSKVLANKGYRTLDLRVRSIKMHSPAEKGGLRGGDIIWALNDEPVYSFDQLRQKLQETEKDKISLHYWREGKVLISDIKPEIQTQEGKAVKLIGVYSAGEFLGLRFVETKPLGFLNSSLRALRRTWDTMIKTVSSFQKLLVAEVSFKTVGGPLAIGKVASDSFNTSISYFFQLMALISINLGIINLLPIPVLDGGHIMFIFLEIINRGPVSQRKMEIAQQVGLSILLMLMVGAIFNDFSRFF